MLVEHARNLIGIADAVHAEYGDAGTAIVDFLACSLADNVIDVDLEPGTLVRRLHGGATSTERTTCNYGLNPDFAFIAERDGLVVSARDDTGEVRAVERTDHRFFVGTLYQPQLSSSSERPHPLFVGFVGAACERPRR